MSGFYLPKDNSGYALRAFSFDKANAQETGALLNGATDEIIGLGAPSGSHQIWLVSGDGAGGVWRVVPSDGAVAAGEYNSGLALRPGAIVAIYLAGDEDRIGLRNDTGGSARASIQLLR